jgi:hypothetical protein
MISFTLFNDFYRNDRRKGSVLVVRLYSEAGRQSLATEDGAVNTGVVDPGTVVRNMRLWAACGRDR